jgi:hypothetical protein
MEQQGLAIADRQRVRGAFAALDATRQQGCGARGRRQEAARIQDEGLVVVGQRAKPELADRRAVALGRP